MTDVARLLDELGAELAFPPTPALAPGVLARVARRRRRRRALVAALAVVAVAAAVLAISPGARSAVGDWLGIGGVSIVRVDELPPVPVRGQPLLGERTTLAAARRRVPFAIALPHGDGAEQPDEVWLRDVPAGGAVTLVYGSAHRPRAVLTEWRGQTTTPVLRKTIAPATRIERVRVGAVPGVWLSGAPHLVFGFDRDGSEFREALWLAGNVLVWELDGRALRLEADVGRDEALRIARTIR